MCKKYYGIFVTIDHAALLLFGQISSTVMSSTCAIARRVGKLFLCPYSTWLVQVLDLPMQRASFATSRSFAQRIFLIRINVLLFFAFIINRCYFNLKYIKPQKVAFVKINITL